MVSEGFKEIPTMGRPPFSFGPVDCSPRVHCPKCGERMQHTQFKRMGYFVGRVFHCPTCGKTFDSEDVHARRPPEDVAMPAESVPRNRVTFDSGWAICTVVLIIGIALAFSFVLARVAGW